MNIVLIILAALLAVAAAGSAFAKLKRVPQVVESMHSVGVSDQQMKGLAALELLGALGIVVGIWIPLIGVLAAAGLTLYFLGAIIAHLRVKQPFSMALPPTVLAVLALVVTLLEAGR